MAKSKKQRELDEELLRECEGYLARQDKPDGAYIEEKRRFYNLNKIKRLIEAGADVNFKNIDDNSRLNWVFLSVKITKLLIKAGADVNSKYYMYKSLFHHAVYRKNVALVKLLISAGVDVNTKNAWGGDTPLHIVRYVAIARLLIKAGADVNAKNSSGKTPLYYARTKKIQALLIEHGATK